jgi:hypothetical protein
MLFEFFQSQAFSVSVNHGMAVGADDNELVKVDPLALSKSGERPCVVHVCIPASAVSVRCLKVKPAALDFTKQPTAVLPAEAGDFRLSESSLSVSVLNQPQAFGTFPGDIHQFRVLDGVGWTRLHDAINIHLRQFFYGKLLCTERDADRNKGFIPLDRDLVLPGAIQQLGRSVELVETGNGASGHNIWTLFNEDQVVLFHPPSNAFEARLL